MVRAGGSVVANEDGGHSFSRGSNVEIRLGTTIVAPINAEQMLSLPFWQVVIDIQPDNCNPGSACVLAASSSAGWFTLMSLRSVIERRSLSSALRIEVVVSSASRADFYVAVITSDTASDADQLGRVIRCIAESCHRAGRGGVRVSMN